MKILPILILGLLLVLSACNNDDESNITCSTDNPLEEISWLKEIRDRFDMDMGPQRQMIIKYRYNEEDVFLIDDCYQCADNIITVYDCEKNIVCEFGGIDGRNTCPDFEQNTTNKVILYDN